LNANDIRKIVIEPSKYYIHITGTPTFSGFSWSFGIVGFGAISTNIQIIEVCETVHSTDYKIVYEWITRN
jgi:hypothetical protein